MLLNGSELRFTPEQMQEKLDEYFKITPVEDITITGVCLHLGIVKDTFYNYAKRKEYKEMVNLARMKVENAYEISLRRHGRAGDIFALKNFGWTDKQEINYTKKPTPTVIVDDSEESN
jgi:hypothetical protein